MDLSAFLDTTISEEHCCTNLFTDFPRIWVCEWDEERMPDSRSRTSDGVRGLTYSGGSRSVGELEARSGGKKAFCCKLS